MRPCDLYLRRGRRYALVGQNGVGKTTLLTRIAAGDIAGFPPGVRCVYVQHEVLATSDASVTDFMRAASAVPGSDAASGDADVRAALAAVGVEMFAVVAVGGGVHPLRLRHRLRFVLGFLAACAWSASGAFTA